MGVRAVQTYKLNDLAKFLFEFVVNITGVFWSTQLPMTSDASAPSDLQLVELLKNRFESFK